MLSDPERPLRRSTKGDNLSTVARAQTLVVLEGLDPTRKRILLQFLYESGLIEWDEPIVGLQGANLFGAKLQGATLIGATLEEANLQEANLQEANLREATLDGANLQEATLEEATLIGAYLQGADLQGAYLDGYDLIVEGAADLRRARHLAQKQIDYALGDETTKLPEGVNPPKSWISPTGEQSSGKA